MEFFDEFFADKVNFEFLKSSVSSMQYMEERRVLEIKEIADSAADFILSAISAGIDIQSALSVSFGKHLFPTFALNHDTLPNIKASVKSFSEILTLCDKTEFTELLLSALAVRGIRVSEGSFLHEEKKKETVSYVKNPYADEGYDVFSTELKNPRVIYSKTFKDALGRVESGEAGYCLLPLEEKGVRLSTVSELIFRGDFKINSVTPVFGFDGLADMKYALVSKSFSLPEVNPDDDRYLELRIPSSGDDISDILLAAKRYGIDIYRINTSVYDTDGTREIYYSAVFRDDGGDFTRLLTYLTVFSKSYIPVGIYKNLE